MVCMTTIYWIHAVLVGDGGSGSLRRVAVDEPDADAPTVYIPRQYHPRFDALHRTPTRDGITIPYLWNSSSIHYSKRDDIVG